MSAFDDPMQRLEREVDRPNGLSFSVWWDMVGEPEKGVWCDECLLPSAVSVSCVLGIAGFPFGKMTITACMDCGLAKSTTEDV
jgi:hypothetical protein